MKCIDLFGGIGGFRLGLEKTKKQFRFIWYNDIDKYACKIYNKNYQTNFKPTDIKTVKSTNIPDFDLLCAGFPCQSFSIAGKQYGFSDTRGTLFFEIARILKDKVPEYFILENVRGLLSNKSGTTIKRIFRILSKLGYQYEWQVINSKQFGVPQNRERIYIAGYYGKGSRRRIFPLTGTTEGTIKVYKRGKHQQDIIYEQDGIMCSLPAGTHASSPHLTKTLVGGGIRRLTPIEWERLQGFPDNWTEGISNAQRYEKLGNAVTVNVIQAIGEII